MPKAENRTSRASAITSELMTEISRQRKNAVAMGEADKAARGMGSIQDVVFVISLLGCLVLTGLNVTGQMPFETHAAELAGSEAEFKAYQTVNFAVRQINAYRRQNGNLPDTLTEVGAPADPRWTYQVVSESRYLVRFEAEGHPLEYDSVVDPDQFFAAVRRHR